MRFSGNKFCVVVAVAILFATSYVKLNMNDSVDVSYRIVSAPRTIPSAEKCSECHQDVYEDFSSAPHRNTLTRANDSEIIKRFSGRSHQFGDNQTSVRFFERDGDLWIDSSVCSEAIRVDWMFGSGRHAMTPVGTLTNPDGNTELIEIAASWFPSDTLGPTPGAHSGDKSGLHSMGHHVGHNLTLECFGCHVTSLPLDNGRIRHDKILAGVSCDRCHPGGEEHIQGIDTTFGADMERWSELSPLESINRCGECHRRADQLTAAELSPQRTILVRFAPVGIAMSVCFAKQSAMPSTIKPQRFDCVTCHNPHRPAETGAAFYNHKCLECHDSRNPETVVCAAEPSSDDCLACHMPKVEVSPGLQLTDHWIRIRNDDDSVTTTE